MDTLELIPTHDPINGIVQIGGSKSYTNRALILAALANGKSTLTSLSLSDDSSVLIRALRQLEISIAFVDETTVDVIGNGGRFKPNSLSIDVGHAGTSMRFLTALCSLVPGKITMDGTPRMRVRPIKDLVDALRHLGADIVCTNNEGFPPLIIRGGSVKNSSVSMSGKVSSQFISALLLIAPVLKNGLEITISDEQISKSYIDMTIDSLKSFGVKVVNDNYKKYSIDRSQKCRSVQYQVEGDASGASYLFALATVTGGAVTVKNINPNSAQGDVYFVDILERMGCKVVKDGSKNTITVSGSQKLKGVSVDMSMMPDTAQTLAVVAAFAQGSTRIDGLSTLRVKETDRIDALKKELSKMGIVCDTTQNSITIHGGVPHGAKIHTYKDHRMALAFSVAGAVINGVQIEEPSVVHKSFPDFWEKIETLGIKTKKV
ncbi:MAG: 3-phosphoshikimate 1-carboxyvinyltransferase [bacterium]